MTTPLNEKSDADILRIIEPLMDNCLAGSNEGDHARHVRDFTDRLRNIVTPENLKAQLEYRPHGEFTKREFVALFRKRDAVGVVWRQWISANDDEFVNHAIFVERDGRVLIDHCLIC
ncbi:MAG: hypothetical protein AAF518_07510 [Spirochaetota bacterium]